MFDRDQSRRASWGSGHHDSKCAHTRVQSLAGGDSSQVLAAQVDRAKARLWDLEQLQKGVLHDALGAPMRQVSFELLACPPANSVKTLQPRKAVNAGQIREAAETLEHEADKFDIRWHLLRDPQELAQSILTREAA
jgi:hypothetical protein